MNGVIARDGSVAGAAAVRPQQVSRARLLTVCVVALVARLAFAWNYGLVQQRFTLSKGSDGYEHIATTIVAGHGYRFNADLGETMFLPPVYPLFLTSIFLLFGPSLAPVQAVQALLDAASCLLVYRLGRHAFGPRIAWLGAWLYACYPGAWVASSRYLTEPLFVFLMLAFVALFADYLGSGRRRLAWFAGLALALAVLCKSAAGALPLFLAGCVVLPAVWRGVRRRVLLGLGVAIVCIGLSSGLWVLRNWMCSGAIVYPTTSGGLALYAAHVYATNPEQRIRDSAHQAAREVRLLAESHGIRPDPRDKYPRWFRTPQDEIAADRIARAQARHFITSNATVFAHHVAGNLWRFWFGAPSAKAVVAAILLNGPLLALALIGLGYGHPWRDLTLRLWLIVCAYLFLAHVGVLAVVRYSLTVMPLVCLLAAWPLAHLAAVALAVRRGRAGSIASAAVPPACGAPRD